jgi:acyl-CoA thioesterase II
VPTIDGLVGALRLDPVGPDLYRAANADAGHGVIFGGQLMAQAVVAALAGHEGRRVKTLHTVFARSGRPDAPVEIAVERMHAGRAFGSTTVTIRQGDRLVSRSLALLTADEPDFIRHADPAPAVAGPDAGRPPAGGDDGDWQVRVAGDADVNDPAAVGPADLDVWTRFAGAPDDPVVDQALLAFATDGFLIGTAMRPHAGVGQSQAHVPRAGPGGGLAAAVAPQPVRGAGPQLRHRPRLPGRRGSGGVVRPGCDDPSPGQYTAILSELQWHSRNAKLRFT